MPRYLIEVKYNGAAYGGFQIQENSNTVQAEVENALLVFFRTKFELTGSSRTDAGVHALQNYFHFDAENEIEEEKLRNVPYHLNAILPDDIAVLSLKQVADDFHCRFDALSREYYYYVYRNKDPFKQDRAYFFPYKLDLQIMRECASELLNHTYFESFAKKHSQAKTFECQLLSSQWVEEEDVLVFKVKGNRFLRGMVRGLVGTMLRAGTGKLDLEQFREVITSGDQTRADFSVPPQGLFLVRVQFDAKGYSQ